MAKRNDRLEPKLALLGFLMPGPKHGYDLFQEYSQELGKVWRIGRSKLYSELKNLEQAGLLTVEMQPQPNRPPRKMYKLTPAGHDTFLEWLHQPTPYLRRLRVEFLARIFFFQHLTLPGLEQLVARQKEILQNQIHSLDRKRAKTGDDYWGLVLEFRRGQLDAVIHWLDCCLDPQ